MLFTLFVTGYRGAGVKITGLVHGLLMQVFRLNNRHIQVCEPCFCDVVIT